MTPSPARRLPVLVLVPVLLVGWAGQDGTARASAQAPHRMPCLGYNGLNNHNPADEVMAGYMRVPGMARSRVANGANVNWALNPFHNRTWQMWFNSLEWLGGLVIDYEKTGDRASLNRAVAITKDWLADNRSISKYGPARREAITQSAKFRLITLVCLRTHVTGNWLDKAIGNHAAYLADPKHWSGPWNHGTDESMILMSAGCATGRTKYAKLGHDRLIKAVFHPPGGARPAIDAQGANNEQSTMYSVYNRARWGSVIVSMRACGYKVPAELVRRHRLMDEFIAFQAGPDGGLVQIGESGAGNLSSVGATGGPIRYVVSRGREGTRPSARTRIYGAGYIMGRSGWGDHGRPFTAEMAYTARFGPGRYAHGQSDHMSLSLYAQGRDILVHSGHIGYNDRTWRNWLLSPEAHSALVVRKARFRAGAATRLTAHRFARGADFFRFSDTAFTGTTRTRSVLALSDPDALVVLDTAKSKSARTAEQLWHLPADFTAARAGKGATAWAGQVRVHFVPIPLRGAARGSARVVRGATKPRQGWVVQHPGRPKPAPVVIMPGSGKNIRMLTLVAPSHAGAKPTVRTVSRPNGVLRVYLGFPGRQVTIELTRDGVLRRLS